MGRAVAILLSDPVSWAGVCVCLCALEHIGLCQYVCVDSVCVAEYSSQAECGFVSVSRGLRFPWLLV